MSNVTTYSIKKIDTAATIFSAKTILGKLVWSGMSDTNVLQIDDADGNEMLYYAKAGLANDYFEFDFNGMSRSLKVTTIGGGTLLLYPYLP
jgi:hypothetical protein